MKNSLMIGFCLLLLLTADNIKASEHIKTEYSYRRYTTHDGLPGDGCSFLYQDSRGFLWIASSSGLSRFDGFEFKVFLKGQYANLFFIKENKRGEVEAFTNNIRYTVDTKADTLRKTILSEHYYITLNSAFLPSGYGVFYSTPDYKGDQHFFAIADSGIVKIIEHEDLDKFYIDTYWNFYYDKTLKHLYIPYPDGVRAVSPAGRIAIHKGVAAYNFIQYENAIWAIAANGLYKLVNGQFEQVVSQKLKTTGMAYAGADNSLLFGDKETIYRYKNKQLEKIFSASEIEHFIVDKEGNLWVATARGLYNLFQLQFKNYIPEKKEDIIGSVSYCPDNNLIIAGSGKGILAAIDGDKITPIHYPKSYPSESISFLGPKYATFSALQNNAVYLPAWMDVLKVSGKNSRWLGLKPHEDKGDTFPYQTVVAMNNGNLLVGTQFQLSEVTPEGKELKRIAGSKIFKQAMFSNPCIDNRGRIWYGGYLGLCIMENDSVVKTLFADEYSKCLNLNKDADGNIWFASESRLFQCVNDSAVLQRNFDSRILNFCFTKKNDVVVVTLDGIYIFDKTLQSFVFYNHENGYTGADALHGDIAEDGNGNIWLPSKNALVRFNPEELMIKQAAPRLCLRSVASSINNVNWSNKDADNLSLDYRHNNIRFEYIGISYSSAQNVRYRYRLKGFQNEWSEPGKMRQITFNNLPPGNYVFEIYADAGTDESRTPTQSIGFTIIPAFWQTAWFLTACIAFLMLASAGIALYIQRRKNKVLLDRLETEKHLNELRIKSIRLKAIPHFNANVLAAIEYYIMNRSRDEAIRLLGIYARFTFQTLREVDKASRSLAEELEYVQMYLELEKLRFIDKFDYKIEIDPDVDTGVQLPNMILHTYCENAVKHGLSPKQSGGLLLVKAVQTGDKVAVSVEDNGVGREAAARNKNVPSSKQGLTILLQQITIYNRMNAVKIDQRVEDLYAEDRQPKGSRFTIEVPLNFAYQ